MVKKKKNSMAQSLWLTSYHPRWSYAFSAYIPDIVEKILMCTFHVSLALALLNSLPVYFLDSESMLEMCLRYIPFSSQSRRRIVLQACLVGGSAISCLLCVEIWNQCYMAICCRSLADLEVVNFARNGAVILQNMKLGIGNESMPHFAFRWFRPSIHNNGAFNGKIAFARIQGSYRACGPTMNYEDCPLDFRQLVPNSLSIGYAVLVIYSSSLA
ncbi:Membrane-bound transcription factor site-2 protease-like protein [Drosera capensis]